MKNTIMPRMFNDRKAEKLFLFLVASMKSEEGRNRFKHALGSAFMTKQTSPIELPTFKITATEVEILFNQVKEKYV